MIALRHIVHAAGIVVLMVLLPVTASGQSELQLAIDAFDRGDFAKAATDLENYVRLRPSDRLAVDYLSRSYVRQGSNLKAIEALERAAKALPGDNTFRRMLGQLYAAVGRYEDADKLLSAHLRANPADTALTKVVAGVLLVQGVRSAHSDRWKEAVGFFDRSLSLDSTSEAIYLNVVTALAHVGDFKRARTIAEKAFRRFPGNLPLHKSFAAALIGAGEYARACGELEQYLKVVPGDIEVGLQLAALYRGLNKADKALQTYDGLIAHHPRDRRAYEALIQYWSNFLRWDKIRETYERQSREFPSDLELLNAIAGTYEKEKRWSDARSVYRAWVARDSLNPKPRLAIASGFRKEKNDTTAADELQRLFALAPRNEEALVMMGDILEKQARLSLALELYANYAAWYPRVSRPHYRMGVVRNRLGLRDSAWSSFERAYDRDPADPYPIAEMAAIASVRGDSVSALKLYIRALSTTLSVLQRQQQQLLMQLQGDKGKMNLENLDQMSVASDEFTALRDLYNRTLGALKAMLPSDAFKEIVDEHLREYPTSIVLLLAQAEWLEEQGMQDRSLETLTRILGINPGIVQAITSMARLHEQRGSLELAMLDYRRLHSIEPGNRVAFDALIRLSMQLSKLNELCDEWKRLYSLRTDDSILKEKLIEALHRANRLDEARALTQ